jgi:hypothetical protein
LHAEAKPNRATQLTILSIFHWMRRVARRSHWTLHFIIVDRPEVHHNGRPVRVAFSSHSLLDDTGDLTKAILRFVCKGWPKSFDALSHSESRFCRSLDVFQRCRSAEENNTSPTAIAILAVLIESALSSWKPMMRYFGP